MTAAPHTPAEARADLVDLIWTALSNAQDMDVTLLDYANAVADALEAERRAQDDRDAEIDVAAIEAGSMRWHGSATEHFSVRWEPYKPDGQRQMKAKGRWQRVVITGDYWRWVNCDRPSNLKPDTPT